MNSVMERGLHVLLTDTTRVIVAIVHYCTFPVISTCIYAISRNFDVFSKRIWSPFWLLQALIALELAAAFEIGNHYYVNEWQLFDPESDLINGSFFVCNFAAQNILALSLRKNLPFFRRGRSFLDWVNIIVDPLLIVLVILPPIVYGTAGRKTATTALSPIAAIAGVFTLFRVWKNLGPNTATLVGGILFLVLVLCGVSANAIYRATDAEWIHIFIGGSFISSAIPLAVAFFNIEDKDMDNDEDYEEVA